MSVLHTTFPDPSPAPSSPDDDNHDSDKTTLSDMPSKPTEVEEEDSEEISMYRSALASLPESHDNYHRFIGALGEALYRRYITANRLEDLSEALSYYAVAAHMAGERALNNDQRIYTRLLVSRLQTRFELFGELADVDYAINAQRTVVHLTSDNNSVEKYESLDQLALLLLKRSPRVHDLSSLDEAISIQRQMLQLTVNRPSDHFVAQHNLSRTLWMRFKSTENLPHLDEAILLLVKACLDQLGFQAPHPALASALSHLCVLYDTRFQRLGNLADINQAIIMGAIAVKMSLQSPDLLENLMNLASAYQGRFNRLNDPADLDRVITAKKQAVFLTPKQHPHKPAMLNNYGNALMIRFEHRGNLSDLEQALFAHTNAVALSKDSDDQKPMYMSNFASCLKTKFERTGSVSDIDRSISVLQQAIECTPDGHVGKASMRNNIGGSFMRRFEHGGDIDDVNAAISAYRHALRLTPDDHASISARRMQLCNALTLRFTYNGKLCDIDDSIALGLQAVASGPNEHPYKFAWLNTIASSLTFRFLRLDNVDDLHEAISVQKQAVALTPDGHASKRHILHNLAILLQIRTTRLGNVSDIEEAVATMLQAVDLTPKEHTDRPSYLNALGVVLQIIFESTQDLSHIHHAIDVHREAVSLAHPGNIRVAEWLDHLGRALTRRFLSERNEVDIHEAVAALKNSVALFADEDIRKANAMSDLGKALHNQAYIGTRRVQDLDEAIEVISRCARYPQGSPSIRYKAAKDWAEWSYQRHGEPSLQAYQLILDRIPQIVWLGTDLPSRFEDLLKLGDVINQAVAAAFQYKRYDLALEWLEQGKTIVWGQVRRLRSPLDDIRRVQPELAKELEDVSRFLERAGSTQLLQSSFVIVSDDGQKISLEMEAQAYRRAAERYEELMTQVHQIQGFEHFLRTPLPSELRFAASHTAVALINVDHIRCDALILRDPSSQPQHILLPDFTYEKAESLRKDLWNILKSSGVRVRETCVNIERHMTQKKKKLGSKRADAEHILKDLWKSVIHPILKGFGFLTIPEQDASLPHITWCVTGPLSFLPLHAAGVYDEPEGQKIYQYAVSSYTPSLTALIEASKRQSSPSPRLLAISQPNTPYHTPLAGTVTEVEMIQPQFGNQDFKWLNAEAATVQSVLDEMAHYSWCHFACHGIQNSEDPLKSSFSLYNGPLELATIMTKQFDMADVAFLSACQTATGDEKRPGEAIHIAAGMLMAGFRTVFGTMWSIGDEDAVIITEEVYSYMLRARKEGDRSGADHSAYALHNAVGRLRRKVGEDSIMRWVPFIHLGA